MTTTSGMNLKNKCLMTLTSKLLSPVEDICEGTVDVDGDAGPGSAKDPDGVGGGDADHHHHVDHAVQQNHYVHQRPVSLLLGQYQDHHQVGL